MDFTHSIDLDDLYASFETEIQQAIDADNYNTYLRYYDNKGMLITFAKQLALESKMPYKEAVFAFLNNHKEVLAELRAKYFPDITVVNVTVRKKWEPRVPLRISCPTNKTADHCWSDLKMKCPRGEHHPLEGSYKQMLCKAIHEKKALIKEKSQ